MASVHRVLTAAGHCLKGFVSTHVSLTATTAHTVRMGKLITDGGFRAQGAQPGSDRPEQRPPPAASPVLTAGGPVFKGLCSYFILSKMQNFPYFKISELGCVLHLMVEKHLGVISLARNIFLFLSQ